MARFAVWAWIAVLAVFFVWLALTVAGGPPPTEADSGAEPPSGQSPADTIHIVENLPVWGSAPTPSLPFELGQEYVLTGAGLQGLLQTAPANKAWMLDMAPAILNVQLVKRGNSPAVVTENVTLTWEMEPQTVTEDGKGQMRRGDMELAEDGLSFFARVPVTAMEAEGALNPYPIVRVTAKNTGSGAALAESAAVLAVSPGFGCSFCHADAGFSILETHDRHQNTQLVEQAKADGPVNCRSCHDGLSPDKDKPLPGKGLSVSAAIHGWHSQYLSGRQADACLTCHTALGRAPGKPEAAPRPLFARDLHIDRGLSCVDCHGSLEDHSLALLKAEKQAGQAKADRAIASIKPQAVDSFEAINPRQPWKQLPDCTGCHDFEKKPRGGEASAFNKWTEKAGELFSRKTEGMAMLRCLSCHGAPHAVYPANNPLGRDRDNIVPIQYQQQAKALGAAGNCALCHMQDMDFSAHHPLVERTRTQVHVPEKAEPAMPRAHFSHESHARLDCLTCHHNGHTDGKSMLCVSSGCHDGATALNEDGSENGKYFRKAFHGPTRSCFYCHSNARMEGKAAGPVACKDCHAAPSPRWAEEEALKSAPQPQQPKEAAPPSNTADSRNMGGSVFDAREPEAKEAPEPESLPLSHGADAAESY